MSADAFSAHPAPVYVYRMVEVFTISCIQVEVIALEKLPKSRTEFSSCCIGDIPISAAVCLSRKH